MEPTVSGLMDKNTFWVTEAELATWRLTLEENSFCLTTDDLVSLSV